MWKPINEKGKDGMNKARENNFISIMLNYADLCGSVFFQDGDFVIVDVTVINMLF